MGYFVKKSAAVAAGLFFALAGMSGDAAEGGRRYKLLLGAGYASLFNLEEPFLDIAKARKANWTFEVRGAGRMSGPEAIAAGYLDEKTFRPTRKAREAQNAAVGVVLSGAEDYPDYYADDYVLDWQGEAYGLMVRWPKTAERARTDNSVEFSLPRGAVTGGALRFKNVGEGFSDFRFYRKKNAALVNRGEIWNPVFINHIRRYDIVRTMDLQSTNNIAIRRFDQIARMDQPWGQGAALFWPEPPFFSIPFEALFDLGVKADVELWMTLPPQIGSPVSPADPSLRDKARPTRLATGALKEAATANASKTLASPEWEIFAKEFVDRYLASGYPLSRPLYLETGNEIWNSARGFFISTNYAFGIAKGVNPEWSTGQGYGVLVGRYMLALEKEFARRKVRPNVIYVIGSHTANPWRTRQALLGLKEYLARNGVDPKDYLGRTGVAITNYYGNFNALSAALFNVDKPAEYAPLWIAEIAKDPDGFARRIEKLLTEGPANVKLSSPWVLARWKEHQAYAEKAGSRLIGAYEGGSHLNAPAELQQSKAFVDWWTAWHWGPRGADVARRVNNDLIKAFPDIIIANYLSVGSPSVKAPWIDGHYARPTPMSAMWDEFAKPAGAR